MIGDNGRMFRRASTVLLVVVSIWAGACTETAGASEHSGKALYTRDPTHLWNRLHRALFVRKGSDEAEYGFDQLDPLVWFRTKYLLAGPAYHEALAVMDEFLAVKGEGLVSDPVKRAILQRDLWAVFDWAAVPWQSGNDAPESKARTALEQRLAAVIRRLALTEQEIEALPDNYAAAVQSHRFGGSYDGDWPTAPFLPAELFSTNSSWVCLGLNGEEAIAPAHVSRFGGRSAFLIFMSTPGGRKEVANYLEQFREHPQPYIYQNDKSFPDQVAAVINPELPVFPKGTVFALVRQLILVNQRGELAPTHLTESVQVRRYNDVHPKLGAYGMAPPEAQTLFEFVLSRDQLFQGMAGGLRARQPEERDFRQFMDKGFDPFEETAREHKPLSGWFRPALDCRECHSGAGLSSVHSFLQNFQVRTVTLPQITEMPVQQQRDTARYWKQRQFSWGLLRGLSVELN
jgi:hypothetical protein